MLAIALGLGMFLAFKKQWLPLAAVAISQAPFWIGSILSFQSGITPVGTNMVTDLSVSALFIFLAYRYEFMWLIWLSIVYVCAGILDVYSLVFGLSFYLEAHEVLHYAALIIIGGRKYVARIDRPLSDLDLVEEN